MLLAAECTHHQGRVQRHMGVAIAADGRIEAVAPLALLGEPDLRLPGRLLLPGTVSTHGNAMQRLLRGRADADLSATSPADAAQCARERDAYLHAALTPTRLQAVAEQVFIEMLLAGVTAAGEVLIAPAADDVAAAGAAPPLALASAWCAAAANVGIRLTLICAPPPWRAGARGDVLATFCAQFESLVAHLLAQPSSQVGWALGIADAPAWPLDALVGLKVRLSHMPLHLCWRPSPSQPGGLGMPPPRRLPAPSLLQSLIDAEVCDACVTLVGAPSATPQQAAALARSGAQLVAAPAAGSPPPPAMADATCLRRSFSYDARRGRSVFTAAQRLGQAEAGTGASAPAALWQAATRHGATSLGLSCGRLAAGDWADLLGVDLHAPALVGVPDALLLPALLREGVVPPIAEVFVAGKQVVTGGRHPKAAAVGSAYAATAATLLPP